MNTSEVLDLSKENIQPLKQGRDAIKLGTALQAQTNAELHQKLLAEREQFELLIRMYEGDDPLKPHYDYVKWTEQSFPKHGPDSNLVQILEKTLSSFKDNERYKQDTRYAELLIKFIDIQSKPIDIYQVVYNQGLCTMCAVFYKAWADELDKNNDIKGADQVYELGKRVKAQPIELLQDAHLQFQLSVGRRMLGHQEERHEAETDYNRQALHKLQKKNIHSVRDSKEAPGRIAQHALGNSNNQCVPFKIYQGDDKNYNINSDSVGKVFPQHGLLNKENTLKPGPWSQHGGKHRSRVHVSAAATPDFKVHEDEDADIGSGHHKISSVPGALKTRKKDTFTCPLAVFEPPDPTKQPMYCKNKVYAGGREFQFEELRAALYNRRYVQLAALRRQHEVENEINHDEAEKGVPEVNTEKTIEVFDPHDQSVVNHEVASFGNLESGAGKNQSDQHSMSQIASEVEVKPAIMSDLCQANQILSPLQPQSVNKLEFEIKSSPLEAHTDFSHCQSFTVNTKEAMNVVQEMWNSPSPAPAFGKNSRASRAYPTSPTGLDESGLFKVPPVPQGPCRTENFTTPNVAPKSVTKTTPSFPIYSDDGPSSPLIQPFNVYCDDVEPEPSQQKNQNNNFDSVNVPCAQPENIAHFKPLPQPTGPSRVIPSGCDAATLKMLDFQSDSDDSCDNVPITSKVKPNNPIQGFINPSGSSTSATISPVESNKKLFGVSIPQHPMFQEEDLTCDTKAFDFGLLSSTPFVGHQKTTASQIEKQCINGSYISEEVKKCGTEQHLSMIFEASKERYSSSSCSSGSKTQGSVCTGASTSVPPVQPELMEKLAQISANKSLGELEKSIGLLNISGNVDPFSTDLISQLLSHIGYPKKHHLIGLHRFESDSPLLHTNSTVKLGTTKYSVIGELGKGNYARVLKATRDGQPVALKQQRPAWEWEWYIVQEVHSRLPPNMMSGYLHMSNGFIYKNASILESEWAQYGTILSVVNKLKIAGKGNDLHLAMVFSIQLISIVEHLHKCKIIHGDIKPDNFVLVSLPSAEISDPCLKLIDFGRSIDMTLFPEGTTFNTVVTTDGFQCNEMKEGRPWTYQTDLYGLAGSIYCVLFYDYMKVIKKDKKWQLSIKFPRYMMPTVWQEIFNSLLNVDSCECLPDLTALREGLEKHFKGMDNSTRNQSINKLTNVLLNK